MKLRILCITFVMLIGAWANQSKAQSREQVYAGLVLHIMKYIEWPSYPEAQMTVGIINDQQLVDRLNALAKGRKVHFRSVSVKKLKDASSLGDIDVLFVPARSIGMLPKVTAKAASDNILVIAEKRSGPVKGVAISFEENKGKLEMNLYEGEIERARFKVSEQLKRVANVVS